MGTRLEKDNAEMLCSRCGGTGCEVDSSRQEARQTMAKQHRLFEAQRLEIAARLTQVEDSVRALRQILTGFEELARLEGFMEGVKEGIADSETGRVSSLEDVVARLVPDKARLAEEQINQSWDGMDWQVRHLADAATEQAYPLGYENGQRSRDAEVAELQEQLDAANERLHIGAKPSPDDDGEYWIRQKLNSAVRHLRDIEDYNRIWDGAPGSYEGSFQEARADRTRSIYEQITSDFYEGKIHTLTMKQERDAALEQVRALVETGKNYITSHKPKGNLPGTDPECYCKYCVPMRSAIAKEAPNAE